MPNERSPSREYVTAFAEIDGTATVFVMNPSGMKVPKVHVPPSCRRWHSGFVYFLDRRLAARVARELVGILSPQRVHVVTGADSSESLLARDLPTDFDADLDLQRLASAGNDALPLEVVEMSSKHLSRH
jgi:hypothetical protein